MLVEPGDAQDVIGAVQTPEVLLWPEQLDAARRRAVGLEPLEHALAVVQHHGRRVHGDRAVRLDAGGVPSLVGHIHVGM
jgi:hypothetical protein